MSDGYWSTCCTSEFGHFADSWSTNQLLGTLPMPIVRRVLLPGPLGNSSAILHSVATAFDEFLPAIAAPLLRPEHAGELADARSRIPSAVGTLGRPTAPKESAGRGKIEATREAAFADGLQVKGRIDLLVKHPSQGFGVIDLKWSRSAKRRREEIATGRALQLATYGAIVDTHGLAPVPGAYYLLRQRRLLGETGSLADEQIDSARYLPGKWEDLAASWRIWRDLAQSGTVLAIGAEEAAAYTPPGMPMPARNPTTANSPTCAG